MRIGISNFLRTRTEKLTESGSLAVAILSLIFSTYGVFIARRAQTYTEGLENSRRSIILIGDTDNREGSLKVTPLQSGMRFLSGYAYFPNEIVEDAVPIDSKGEIRWIKLIMNSIERHVLDSTPTMEGYESISEGGIPVVLYSYYAFEGQVYEDWSLYNTTFLAQGGSLENRGQTTVHLTGLIFGKRINSMNEEEAKRVPDALWDSMKEQNFGLPEMSQ